jgi:hypothetical protein
MEIWALIDGEEEGGTCSHGRGCDSINDDLLVVILVVVQGEVDVCAHTPEHDGSLIVGSTKHHRRRAAYAVSNPPRRRTNIRQNIAFLNKIWQQIKCLEVTVSSGVLGTPASQSPCE